MFIHLSTDNGKKHPRYLNIFCRQANNHSILLFIAQKRRYLVHGSRAEYQNNISFFRIRTHFFRRVGVRRSVFSVPRFFGKHSRIHTGNIHFPCRIYIDKQSFIRHGKYIYKIIEKRRRARKGMRFENTV